MPTYQNFILTYVIIFHFSTSTGSTILSGRKWRDSLPGREWLYFLQVKNYFIKTKPFSWSRYYSVVELYRVYLWNMFHVFTSSEFSWRKASSNQEADALCTLLRHQGRQGRSYQNAGKHETNVLRWFHSFRPLPLLPHWLKIARRY